MEIKHKAEKPHSAKSWFFFFWTSEIEKSLVRLIKEKRKKTDNTRNKKREHIYGWCRDLKDKKV